MEFCLACSECGKSIILNRRSDEEIRNFKELHDEVFYGSAQYVRIELNYGREKKEILED